MDEFAGRIQDYYIAIGATGCYPYGYTTVTYGKKTLFDAHGYTVPLRLKALEDELQRRIESDCASAASLMKENGIKSVICVKESCDLLGCMETVAKTKSLELKYV